MNKLGYFIIVIGVIILIALTVCVIMAIGTKIDVELDGIQFRLGTDNIEHEVSVALRFDGRYVNSFLGHNFEGDIYIDGHKLNENIKGKTSIPFNKYNSGPFYDTGFDYNTVVIGMIYINDDFSKVAICINESSSEHPDSKYWDSDTGFMVAAPASNREQALAISNEVMESFLQKEME